jgi:alpha-galactosidase
MKTHIIGRILATAAISLPSALFAVDTDSDGLDDSVETNTGIYVSPTNTGTNPNNPDSDGDGAGDWYEVAIIDVAPTAAQPNAPNSAAIKPNIPYPLPVPDSTPPATNKPVKVYILSGQSNMVGQGNISPLGTAGTLETITKTDKKFPNLLNGNAWSVRNDVRYRGVIAAIGNSPLIPGYNNGTTAIGPEIGFGHVMGYHHSEPVLVIKSSEGGRALGSDFLPPGSVQYTYGSNTYPAYGGSPISWPTGSTPVTSTFYAGFQYDQCFLDDADMVAPPWADATTYPQYAQVRSNGQVYVCKTNPNHISSPISEPGVGAQWTNYWTKVFNVTDVLDNFANEYPQWAAQGFEIAGFAWFHGWNDGLSYTGQYAYRYEQNMAQFIRQIRAYYESRYPGKIKPRAPFVIATAAFEGWNEAYLNQYPTRRAVIDAQHAVPKAREFSRNVKTMEARGFWRDKSISPAPGGAQGYHYNRHAETFMLVGDALGRGMIDLLAFTDTTPPTLAASAIVDNKSGGPVAVNALVTYTVTFSEDMDASTVSADDFGNAGTAAFTIGTVAETSPGVFSVPVTPTSAGTLQFQVNQNAVLKDNAINSLNTASPIPDNTILVVGAFYAAWTKGPFQGTLGDTNPGLDFDGGSLPTGIEWVVGGDPTHGGDDAGLAPTLDATTDPSGKFLFTYRRRDGANIDPNTEMMVEYCGDPNDWTTALHQGTGAQQITITEAPGDPGFSEVTVALPGILADSGKLFVRLKVVVATQ